MQCVQPLATCAPAFSSRDPITLVLEEHRTQFLSVHCSEIDAVVISSSTGPDSFTLDDLTYPISDSSIPEPATLVLVSTGLLGVLRKKFWM